MLYRQSDFIDAGDGVPITRILLIQDDAKLGNIVSADRLSTLQCIY